jgi:hypothetical protein
MSTQHAPLSKAELEADTWACWWLAHEEIGRQYKAGAPLPALFVPRPAREERDRVRMGEGL